MTDWRPSSLAELIDIKHGFAFKGQHFVDYEADDVLVTPGNFAIGGGFKSDKLKYYEGPVPEDYVLHPGDLIVTMTDLSKQADTLGYSAIVPKNGPRLLHNQRIGLVTSKDKAVGLDFPGWLMRTPTYRNCVVGSATGSTVKHTSPSRIKEFEFLLPPEHERNSISTTLNALDDKIELNRRMNETPEAQARALFRDWFVDFGPVKAKMAGATPYLAPNLWSLFPDCLGDDGVPEGWASGTLADVASLNPETWSAKNAPSVVEYADLSNTKWGTIESTTLFAWGEAPSRARRVLQKGDTVIGTVRPGNGSFAFVGVDGLTGSTGFAVLRPKAADDRSFTWCAATDPQNIDRLAHLADGGAYPAVRPELILATEIVSASARMRHEYEKMVGTLLDRIEHNKLEAKTLAQTRDLLLPKLMSGEIRISNVERELELAP